MNLCLTGDVLVSDIVLAFEGMLSEETIALLDKELAGRANDRISFDDIWVTATDAVDALDEADELPSPESLAGGLDESDVRGLAEAIRCGDREEAELLLDRMFGGDTTIREWIDLGRYSRKAREARQAQNVPVQRKRAA